MIERSNGFEDFIKECSEKRAGVSSLSGTEKQMPELSIESVFQLLLEDREIIKTQVSNPEILSQFLMQNTSSMKELLQIKLIDDEQRNEFEEQACESIAAELERGNEAGVLLAEHLINMSSSEGELNVSVDGHDFKIVIEQTS